MSTACLRSQIAVPNWEGPSLQLPKLALPLIFALPEFKSQPLQD